jgi:hypothetical protein
MAAAEKEERAPDEEPSKEEYYIIDGKKVKFSFPPGSSAAVSAFERNVNAPRRKAPKDGISPTLTAPVAPPSEYYNDPSFGVEISLADEILPEETIRRIQRAGHDRNSGMVNLPMSWLDSMLPAGWRDKKKALDLVHLYFTADRSMIIITARPPVPADNKKIMERNLNLKVYAADSDEEAQAAEEEEETSSR